MEFENENSNEFVEDVACTEEKCEYDCRVNDDTDQREEILSMDDRSPKVWVQRLPLFPFENVYERILNFVLNAVQGK